MIESKNVLGIAVGGKSPTALAVAVRGHACPFCAFVAVQRYLVGAGAVSKLAPFRRALARGGSLPPHTGALESCTASA